MVLEDLFGHVEVGAFLRGGADLGDLRGGNDLAVVAKGEADEAQDRSGFGVVEDAAEARHGRDAFARVEGLSVHGDRTPEALEDDLDRAFIVIEPVALGQRRIDVRQPLAVGLVARGAVRVAEIDLPSELENLVFGCGQLAGGLWRGVGDRQADLGFAGEVFGRGGVVREVELAAGLQGRDVVLQRVG